MFKFLAHSLVSSGAASSSKINIPALVAEIYGVSGVIFWPLLFQQVETEEGWVYQYEIRDLVAESSLDLERESLIEAFRENYVSLSEIKDMPYDDQLIEFMDSFYSMIGLSDDVQELLLTHGVNPLLVALYTGFVPAIIFGLELECSIQVLEPISMATVTHPLELLFTDEPFSICTEEGAIIQIPDIERVYKFGEIQHDSLLAILAFEGDLLDLKSVEGVSPILNRVYGGFDLRYYETQTAPLATFLARLGYAFYDKGGTINPFFDLLRYAATMTHSVDNPHQHESESRLWCATLMYNVILSERIPSLVTEDLHLNPEFVGFYKWLLDHTVGPDQVAPSESKKVPWATSGVFQNALLDTAAKQLWQQVGNNLPVDWQALSQYYHTLHSECKEKGGGLGPVFKLMGPDLVAVRRQKSPEEFKWEDFKVSVFTRPPDSLAETFPMRRTKGGEVKKNLLSSEKVLWPIVGGDFTALNRLLADNFIPNSTALVAGSPSKDVRRLHTAGQRMDGLDWSFFLLDRPTRTTILETQTLLSKGFPGQRFEDSFVAQVGSQGVVGHCLKYPEFMTYLLRLPKQEAGLSFRDLADLFLYVRAQTVSDPIDILHQFNVAYSALKGDEFARLSQPVVIAEKLGKGFNKSVCLVHFVDAAKQVVKNHSTALVWQNKESNRVNPMLKTHLFDAMARMGGWSEAPWLIELTSFLGSVDKSIAESWERYNAYLLRESQPIPIQAYPNEADPNAWLYVETLYDVSCMKTGTKERHKMVGLNEKYKEHSYAVCTYQEEAVQLMERVQKGEFAPPLQARLHYLNTILIPLHTYKAYTALDSINTTELGWLKPDTILFPIKPVPGEPNDTEDAEIKAKRREYKRRKENEDPAIREQKWRFYMQRTREDGKQVAKITKKMDSWTQGGTESLFEGVPDYHFVTNLRA